ncbi:unnamed protein product, partial [Staurois parvus]
RHTFIQYQSPLVAGSPSTHGDLTWRDQNLGQVLRHLPGMGATASCRTGRRRRQHPTMPSVPPESLLDINLATEEELMTLPGVTRALAQSITAHRRKIRTFRRVEDLALVTGVGAEHMLKLRPEITVREIPTQWAVSEGEMTPSDDTKEEGNRPEETEGHK